MKILRASFVTHCISNCLNSCYLPLDLLRYGWDFEENQWEPIWFEGTPLPHPGYADESNMAEESGTILESEMVESGWAHFGESEEISDKWKLQWPRRT